MGAMLVPALIGAGVGAVGGAVAGKNPLTTALLGAGIGAGGAGLLGAGGATAGGATTAGTMGVGAGEGLIGGANLTGAGIASGAGATGATSGLGSFLSSIKGVETAPVSFGTGGYASGITSGLSPVAGLEGMTYQQAIGNAPISNIGYTNPVSQEMGSSLATTAGAKGTPLSMMDKVGNYITNLPSNTMNWIENNPLSSAKMALDVAIPAPTPQIQAPIPPILRGNYDPSSPLMNVSPRTELTNTKQRGLIDMMAHIPLTDEERMRLQQLSYRG